MRIGISEQFHNEILIFFLNLEKNVPIYIENHEAHEMKRWNRDGMTIFYGTDEELEIENKRRRKLPKTIPHYNNFFTKYHTEFNNFEKDLVSKGYSTNHFSKKYTIICGEDDFNLISLSISINSNDGHFSCQFQTQNFYTYEGGSDGYFYTVYKPHSLNHPLTSQNYNYTNNQEGQRIKDKIKLLTNQSNEVNSESNRNQSQKNYQQKKSFDLVSFFTKYWIWIILAGLAIYGFIVQNSD